MKRNQILNIRITKELKDELTTVLEKGEISEITRRLLEQYLKKLNKQYGRTKM